MAGKDRVVEWPEGKRFAFTIFDDTDRTTLDNGPQVYSALTDLGYRVTKTVWPLDLPVGRSPDVVGMTCANPAYLAWVKDLERAGHEIAVHNVTAGPSKRETTILGLNRFREMFGHDPISVANHSKNKEGLYWGPNRLTGINQGLYRLLTRNKWHGVFEGHVETSQYFWGDVCKERIRYVRSFVFSDINTLKQCPFMPYHDPKRPYAAYWFAGSSGPTPRYFFKTLSEENQDRLEEEGGACILYAHLGAGFSEGTNFRRFKQLMERLAQKKGWFVPTATLLDFLRDQRGHRVITPRERSRLERRWLTQKLLVGRTN